MSTTKIGVYVAHRNGFKGVFAGGQHWPDGTTYRELEDKPLKAVLSKDKAGMLKVVAIGAAACADHAALEKDAARAREQLEHEVGERLSSLKGLPEGVGPRGGAVLPPLSGPSAEDLQRQAQAIDHGFEELAKGHENQTAQQKLLDQTAEALAKKEAALAAREKDLDLEAKTAPSVPTQTEAKPPKK